MVAVVSGSGLGLFNSSASTLGGQDGNPVVGRGNDRAFVNTANGNLIVQSVDDVLASRGLDAQLVRTYNSQGLFDGDNDDGWRIGFYRRVALNGTLGDPDSTVIKTFGDGSEIVYRYDSAAGHYVSTDGDGAHDTLSFSGGQWTWTDGTTLVTETYEASGRLVAARDSDNNTIQYLYTGNLLTEVLDASGQQTFLQYVGNQLASVRTVSQGQQQTRTHYSYDAQGRLSEVHVDYSATDGSIADRNTFVTTYRYVGTTNLLEQTTQRGGIASNVLASQTFTYEFIGGMYRVKTVTDGEDRVTTFNYTLSSNSGGQVTSYAAVDESDLSTTDTQITEVPYARNDAALTTPTAGWVGAALLESANGAVLQPEVAFDANGNGFAVWAQGGDVFARRYTRVNDTWAAAVPLDTNGNTASAPTLALDDAGNAVVAWAQSDGAGVSAYGVVFNATTGTWSTASPLEGTNLAVATTAYSVSASIAGTQAAVAFLQTDGTRNNAYVARWTGSAWSAATLVEARNNAAAQPSVAVDSLGNVSVVLQQSNGTANSLYVNRYTASTATWSGATLLETTNTAVIEPKIAFDANGNGFAAWVQGGDVFARSYSRATNTWAAAVPLDGNGNTASAPTLSVDAAGNAVVAWAQSNGTAVSAYAALFNATSGSWSAATPLESTDLAVATTAYSISAEITGTRAAVAWLQTDGTRNNAYVARWDGSAWAPASLVEARTNAAAQPSVAIDALGNAVVAIQQSNGTANSFYANRYVGDTTPYYTVAAGNTWRSIANAVYGVDSDAAGQELSEQLVGQSLTLGHRLTGFPPTLMVPTSTIVTVPPYYDVLGTDDWESITDTLYGTRDPNAVLALQGATGSPTLVAGLNLTVPATLIYTPSGAVSITAGNPLISTTDQVTTTQQYDLLSAAASNASSLGWQPPQALENRETSVVMQYPRIHLNANGDGFALWTESQRVYARRFDGATQTWGPETVVSDVANQQASPDEIATDLAGNAVAVWRRWNPATSNSSLYTSAYSAATGLWGPATLVGEGAYLYAGVDAGQRMIKMSAAAAAFVYVRYEGGVYNLYVKRYVGGAWSEGLLMENGATSVSYPGIALDDAGNVTVSWVQSDGTRTQIYSNRWLAGASSPVGVYAITSSTWGSNDDAQLAGDAQGNLIAAWREGTTLMVRRFDAASGTWQAAQSIATNTYAVQVRMDAIGNAVLVWSQQTGSAGHLLVSRFDRITDSWSLPDIAVSPTATLHSWQMRLEFQGDNIAVVLEDQSTGSRRFHITIFRDGVWSALQPLQLTNIHTAFMSMDAAGNIGFVEQRDGMAWYPSAWTMRFNAPYYTVPSDASWRSIANALYGVDSDAAGNALRDELGNPPLIAGTRLINLPTRLIVATTSTQTVPTYYVVQAGDTWSSIAQAIYGTTSASIEATLRRVTGDPQLAAGLHLTVPQTLYHGSDTIYLQTDVIDDLGAVNTYVRDAQGRLTAHRSPEVDGVRIDDRYEYDAAGNLTRVIQNFGGLHRVTDLAYDGRGNLTDTWDSLGNATTRAYDQWNQLLSVTTYTGTDPDGSGNTVASGAMTTHYVYDTMRRLRFVVSADQRVTEYRYSNFGERNADILYTTAGYSGAYTVNALGTWVNTQNLTRTERTDYLYDFRGNLTDERRYQTINTSGSGDLSTSSNTSYQYDQRGQLMTRWTPVGSAYLNVPSSRPRIYFSYDALGKVTNSNWILDSMTVTSTYTRDAISNYEIAYENFYNGNSSPAQNTRTYSNLAGQATTVTRVAYINNTNVVDTTTYAYDAVGRLRMATDSLGVRTYKLYDAMGRTIGDIDGEGRLTRYFYNGASEVIKTQRYSRALDATALATLTGADGKPAEVSIDTLVATLADRDALLDQIARAVYDAAGRLVYSIDASGGVIQTHYDGAGRVIGTTAFFNRLANGIPDDAGEVSVAQLAPGGVHEITPEPDEDRVTRHFYDADGNLRAVLDGEGYLTEYKYDSAGRLIEQVAYANLTPVAERASGTLDALRPAEDLPEHTDDPESDIRSYFLYDVQGRRVGAVDGKGYLTETVYDGASNIAHIIRYENAVTVTASSTLASLRPATGINRTTSFLYNGQGHVIRQTNHEGTVTNFTRDVAGNAIFTTHAAGTTEARNTRAEFDGFGRITRELSAEGGAAIAGGMAAATAWSLYGTRYEYDTRDRRIASIDPNGTRTLYFYDKSGNLRFALRDLGNGTGELSEMRYDALGQLTETVGYSTRISTASLSGGLVNETILARALAAADPLNDSVVANTFWRTGELRSVTDNVNASSWFDYNAFGDLTAAFTRIDDVRTREHGYTYDRRGQLTLENWEPEGIERTEATEYDAFGRQKSVTDQYGNVVRTEYDTLGRVVTTVDALGNSRTSTYDAFSRVRTTTDALQGETVYEYDDAARSVEVTTPEGITVTTVHYRDGQVFTVTDADDNVTTYTYDTNGRLQSVSDGLGTLESRTYDRGGRLETVVDGRNVTTRLQYDAANRLFTRTQDFGGLALQTVFEYDGQGRVIRVTEPGNRVTRTTYYADGQVHEVIVDENGLALRTEYFYDGTKNVVAVTENVDGAGPNDQPRRTEYYYDDLGRRTHQIVDPTSFSGASALNLVTEFRYDRNGNVTRKIDAELNSTWYVYDDAGQLRQTIDALGGVTELEYDSEGRVVLTRRRATALVTSPFQSQDILGFQTVAASVQDRLSRSVYDADGRERFTVATLRVFDGTIPPTEYGLVTERTFDDRGNVTSTRVHDQEILVPGQVDEQGIAALVSASANDRLQTTVYDVRDRAIFLVDVYGGVTRQWFDGAGNLVRTTSYATATGVDLTYDDLNAWTQLHDADEGNRTKHFWFDNVGRVRFALDAEGYLKETQYLDAARQEVSVAYADAPSFGGTVTLAWIEQNLPTDLVNDRRTTTYRDAANRIVLVEQSLRYESDAPRTLSEHYTYDGLGNKRTYQNANGAIWTYVYDANGRLRDEITPEVDVTTISEQNGTLTPSSPERASIITRLTYDNLGNVETRTEGIRLVNGTELTAGSRTTTYVYDLLGRQTTVIHPEMSVYDGAPANSVTNIDPSTQRVERSHTPVSTTTYNALGDAVMNVDVSGARSRKAYDNLGRVRFEVDALGYVTEYGFDVFGNVETVKRHATPINAASLPAEGAWSVGEIDLWTSSSADDRTITNQYDRMNRRTRVLQPEVFSYIAPTADPESSPHSGNAAGRIDFEYNAFGELRLERRLLDHVTGETADTRYFYDGEGRRTYTLDALGYVTEDKYDARGNVTEHIEYSRQLAASANGDPRLIESTDRLSHPDHASGYDRRTEYLYDSLDRVRLQRVHEVEFATGDYVDVENDTDVSVQEIRFGYDAVGNRVSITDAYQAVTRTYYDSLGRIRALIEPIRAADTDGDFLINSGFLPLVEMRRDVFGNLVEQVRHGASASNVTELAYTAPAAGPTQWTRMDLDLHGRARRTQDSSLAMRHFSYNERGDMAKEWQVFADLDGRQFVRSVVHEYDALGREITTIEPQRRNDTEQVEPAEWQQLRTAQFMDEGSNEQGLRGQWIYWNEVDVTWAPTGSDELVSVWLDYTRYLPGNYGTGDTHRQIDYVSGNAGFINFNWTDENSQPPDLPLNGGIHSIQRVRVFGRDAQGQYTVVLRDSQPTTLEGTATHNSQVAFVQQKYNAFGEVVARGINDERQPDVFLTYQETWEYDRAGRVWRTNSDDGVFKVYLYDVAGRNTAEIRSKGNGTIADAPSPGAALSNANTLRAEQVYDALDRVVLQRSPELEVDTALEPAINDVFINVIDDEPTIYWTATPDPDVTVIFEYYSTVQDRWIEIPVIQVSPTQMGARLTDLEGPLTDYRVSLRKTLQFQPYARTRGTFRFDETRVVTIDQFTRIAPEPPIATLAADHAGAIITWAAPADTTVSATMRFQRDGTSTWINVDAVRQGNVFVVDARNVLTEPVSYGYQIVYVRDNELIALNTGGLSVGETTYTRVFSTQSNSNTTTIPPTTTIPEPSPSGTGANRTLTWTGPAGNAEGAFVAQIRFRHHPDSNYSAPVTLTHNGSGYSLNVAALDINPAPAIDDYDYHITYKAGERVLAEQYGHFWLTDAASADLVNIEVWPGGSPPPTPPIPTITGTAGGQNVNWSELDTSYVYEISDDGAFVSRFYWGGGNSVRPSWTGSQSTAWVVIDYVTLGGDWYGTYGNAYSEAIQVQSAGTMTRDVLGNFSAPNTGGAYGALGGNIGPAGVSEILRMRVYTAQNGTLIADSNVPATTGPGITWQAPAGDTNFTANVYYANGGGWTFIGSAQRAGDIFSINLTGVPSGQIKIEYVRPGQSWAFNTATATLTQGSGAPTLSNQVTSNHDPAGVGVNGALGTGRLEWWGAVASGGRVTLETKMPGGEWTVRQQWTSGDTFYYDFTSIGSTTPPMVEYRITYEGGPSEPWPHLFTQGVFYPRRIIIDQPATVTYDSSQTWSYTAAVIAPQHTGTSLQWTHPRGAPENTIRVTYWRLNQVIPHVAYIEGNGPTFNFDFPGIENTGGSIPVFWELDYFRPNETNSFARARGQSQVTASTTTNYPNVHINFQYAVFPSGLLEIPVPYQDPNNPNVLRWNLAPSYVPGVSVRINGLSFLPSADGMSVDISTLPSNPPGEVYEYDIMFIGQGATTAYARGRGTFRLVRTTEIENLQVQRFPGGGAYDYAPSDQRMHDRWGNVISYTDTAMQQTLYRYNVFGMLAATRNPRTGILDTRSDPWPTAPPERIDWSYTESYYDLMGRAVATRDENNNVNGVTYNTAGQKVAEWHADTGSKTFLYDGLGRQTQVTDEIGWRTRITYDGANRQTAINTEFRPEEWLTREFTYDSVGNRTSETSGDLGSSGPEKTEYYFDLAGNVIRRRTELDAETFYAYDLRGHKTSETDPLFATMTWEFDHFGRVQAHVDLGGATTNYFYNGAGLLDLQTSSRGQHLNFEYDSAGNVRTIIDSATGSSVVYGYDSAGRRSTERTFVDNVMHQDSQIVYDERGRISQLADLRYALEYRYDAAGNRTRTNVRYRDHQLQLQERQLDYVYDEMNRVVFSDTSSSITYNLAGQRQSAVMYGTHWVRQNANGELRYGGNPGYENADPRPYTETYYYDGAGRLYSTWRTGLDAADQPINREVEYREYDGASRLIRLDDKVERTRTRYTYNDDGHQTIQTARWSSTTTGSLDDSGPLKSLTVFEVDAAGVQRGYTVDAYTRSQSTPSLSTLHAHYEYTNAYRAADSYLLQEQYVEGHQYGGHRPGPYVGSIERIYDVNNHIVQLHDDNAAEGRETRYFANNIQGQALTAIEGNFADDAAVVGGFQLVTQGGDNPYFAQHFFHVNGKYAGSFGQLHGTGVDDDPDQFEANFDTNFTPISAQFPAPTPGNIVVQEGDTLRSLSARIFGDPSLWYLLAEENGLTDPDTELQAGTTLRVPNQVYSLANTNEVFKPFDINEAIGDRAASLKYIGPPHEYRLSGLKAQTALTIISIVVTLIVSYWLGPASGPAMTFFNGAISALAGNAAAQGVAIWMGMQEKFDWNSAARSALAGAIGAGVMSGISNMGAFQGRPVAASFVGGAVGNAVTQGAAIMLDLQESFSWKDVASAAFSSAASTKAGLMMDKKFGKPQSFIGDVSRSLVTGSVSSVVDVAFGGRFDRVGILTDAFGTALINSVVRQSQGAPEPERSVAPSEGESYDAQGELTEVVVTAAAAAEMPGRIEPVPLFDLDPRNMIAGTTGGYAVYGGDEEPVGTSFLPDKEIETVHRNLQIEVDNFQRLSGELAAIRAEERGIGGTLVDIMPWDSAYEKKLARAEAEVELSVKYVMRYAAIVDISRDTNYIPKKLLNVEYFNRNVSIDTKSSVLTNAKEVAAFVSAFKGNYNAVTNAVTNGRRLTGIINLFTKDKQIGGLSIFMNKFARALEKSLKTVGKTVDKIAKPVEMAKDAKELWGKVEEDVLQEMVKNPLSEEKQNEYYDLGLLDSQRGPVAVIQFGRGLAGVQKIVDEKMMKTIDEAKKPASWLEKLIDVGQDPVTPKDMKD